MRLLRCVCVCGVPCTVLTAAAAATTDNAKDGDDALLELVGGEGEGGGQKKSCPKKKTPRLGVTERRTGEIGRVIFFFRET